MADHPEAEMPRGWRSTLGFLMFVVPFPIFILTPLVVPFLGYSATETAAIIGTVVIVVEVIWFASIPLLGKAGFKQLKGQAFGLVRLPPGPVSHRRHVVGLWMLLVAVLIEVTATLAVVVGYFWLPSDVTSGEFLGLDFEQEAQFYVWAQVSAVLLFVASLYILSMTLLGRLREAFVWNGADRD